MTLQRRDEIAEQANTGSVPYLHGVGRSDCAGCSVAEGEGRGGGRSSGAPCVDGTLGSCGTPIFRDWHAAAEQIILERA